MAEALAYPLIRGFRHGFASLKFKFALDGGKTVQVFMKSVNYGRTRSRGWVRGNHPDPIAKTRGENEYRCDVEMPVAEYRLLVQDLGAGYGDKIFTLLVTYGENGFETVTDEIEGCTLDDDDSSNGAGPDPLMRKLTLNPTKIRMSGIDDLEVPLFQAAA